MVDECHFSLQSHQHAIERDLEGNPPPIEEEEDFEGCRGKPLVSPPLQPFQRLPSACGALKRVAMGKGREVPFRAVRVRLNVPVCYCPAMRTEGKCFQRKSLVLTAQLFKGLSPNRFLIWQLEMAKYNLENSLVLKKELAQERFSALEQSLATLPVPPATEPSIKHYPHTSPNR